MRLLSMMILVLSTSGCATVAVMKQNWQGLVTEKDLHVPFEMLVFDTHTNKKTDIGCAKRVLSRILDSNVSLDDDPLCSRAFGTYVANRNSLVVKVFAYADFRRDLDFFTYEMEVVHSAATSVSTSGKELTTPSQLSYVNFVRKNRVLPLGELVSTVVSPKTDYIHSRVSIFEDDGATTGQIEAAERVTRELKSYVETHPDRLEMFTEGLVQYLPLISILVDYGKPLLGLQDDAIGTPALTLHREDGFTPVSANLETQGDLVRFYFIVYADRFLFVSHDAYCDEAVRKSHEGFPDQFKVICTGAP